MLEEVHEREKERLDENLKLWEECYRRFKSRFDEFSEYEKRIHELELQLEKRDRRWRIVERERNSLIALAILLTLATIFFLRTLSQIENVWIFFIAGLIMGLGWATLLQVLIRVPFFR
jgi:hypothetical protein